MAFTGAQQPQQAELHQHPQQRGPSHRIWHRSRRRLAHSPSCPRQTCLALLAHVVHHHRLCSVDPKNQAVQTCQASTLNQPCNGSNIRHMGFTQQQPAEAQQGGTGNWQAAAGLTRKIKACSNVEQLQRVLDKHSAHTFNHIHATAIATRTAQLLAQERPSYPASDSGSGTHGSSAASWALVLQLLHLVGTHLTSLDARGVANVLWALASIASSLGLQPQHQHNPNRSPGLHDTHQPDLGRQQPQLSWSMQTDRPHGTLAQHGSNAVQPLNGTNIYSASTGVHPTGLQGTVGAQQQCSELPSLLHSMGSTLLMRAAHLGWSRCNSQQLSNMLWAAATLSLQLSHQQGQQCLNAVVAKASGSHAVAQEAPLTAQGYSSIVWACAHLRLVPPAQLISLGPSLMTDAQPQAVSNVLWGVAQLNLHTSHSWVAQLLATAQPSLPQFSSQALANTAWALAHLQHIPTQPWLQEFMAACTAQLSSMSPRHLASIIWALSCMSQQQETAAGHQAGGSSTAQLHLPHAWLCSIAEHVQPILSMLQPQELSMISQGLADLGWAPTQPWASAWVTAVHTHLASSSMHPQSLSCCAAAAACWLQQLQLLSDASSDQHSAVQPLQALLNEACLQLAKHARHELHTGQQQQQQQQQHLLASHVNGKPADSIQLQTASWQHNGVAASPSLNGQAARQASLAPSDTGLTQADVWLQLLTVLSAAQWQALRQWRVHNCGQGLTSVAHAAMQHAVAGKQPPPAQLISLCWALAKLGITPNISWRQQVVVPLIERCCHLLELPGVHPHLTVKELSLLTWSCKQWGMADACLPLMSKLGQRQHQDVSSNRSSANHLGADADAAQQQPVSQLQQDNGAGQLGNVSPSWLAMSLVTLASHWHTLTSQAVQQPSQQVPLTTEGSNEQGSSPQGAESATGARQAQQVATARNLLQMAGRLASLPAEHPQALSAADLSRCLWAAARMGYRPSMAWAEAMQARLLHLLHAGTDPVLIGHLPLCMWSMAKLHITPPPATAAQLLHACLHVGEACGHPLLSPRNPERLVCVVSACKLWRMQPGMKWWQAIFNHPAWPACLAALSHSPLPPWCMLASPTSPLSQDLEGSSVDSSVSLQVSTLFNLAGSTHVLEVDSKQQQQQGSGVARDSPQQLTGWSVDDVRSMLRVLVALQLQPPDEWLRTVRGVVLLQLLPSIHVTLTQRELSRRQQEVPDQLRQRGRLWGKQVHLLALTVQLLSPSEEQQLHDPAAGRPVPWLVAALCAAELCVPCMSLGSMCSLLLACGRYAKVKQLKQVLDDVIEAVLRYSGTMLQQATPAQLLRLLRALAAVHARPPPDWSASLQAAVKPRLHHLNDQQLAVLLPALADAHCRPDREFLVAYLHLVTPRIVPEPAPTAQRTSRRQPTASPPSPRSAQASAAMPALPALPAGQGATAGVLQLSDAPVRVLSPTPPSAAAQQQQQQQQAASGDAHAGSLLQQPAYLSGMLSALHWADPGLCTHWRAQVGLYYQSAAQ